MLLSITFFISFCIFLTPVQIMSRRVNANAELLIHGYIHQLERDYNVSSIIPNEIYGVIIAFYPQLLKFELFDSQRFQLLDDGYQIKGKSGTGCSGYTIYPECLVVDGYKKGIHFWSVQLLGDVENDYYCYHSVGIVANKRNEKWCNSASEHWPITDSASEHPRKEKQPSSQISWYNGHENDWNRNEIITVKLNCDEGFVVYYENDEEKRKDQIDSKQSYYFAMNTCEIPRHYYKVVNTPLSIT